MKIEIDLPDRLFEDVKELCEYNNEPFEKYIVNCISDTYYTLKYGDLNLKFNRNKEEHNDIKTTVNNEEKTVIEKKKVGRPRKKAEEVIKTEDKEKQIIEKTVFNNGEETVLKKEEVVNIIDEQLQNKIKRTKRILKVK